MSIKEARYIFYEGDVVPVVISAASSGDNELVAASATDRIRVLSCYFISAGTVNFTFESSTGGPALSGALPLVANTGMVLGHNPEGWATTAAGASLNLILSGAIQVSGFLNYVLIPVNA